MVSRLHEDVKNYNKHLRVAFNAMEKDKNSMESIKSNNFKTKDFFMTLRTVIIGGKFILLLSELMIIFRKEEYWSEVKAAM